MKCKIEIDIKADQVYLNVMTHATGEVTAEWDLGFPLAPGDKITVSVEKVEDAQP